MKTITVPNAIAEVIDFAAVHVYPFLDTFYNPTAYDWRQKAVPEAQRAQAMMDATLAEAKLLAGQQQAAAALLLDVSPRPTAILAMSDAMAIGAARVAREQGLRIPDDLSVVGFDDIDLAKRLHRALIASLP